MIVGVVKESYPGERRVALVPAVLPLLVKAGHEVCMEAGAGSRAGYPDPAYAERGTRIVGARAQVFAQADVMLQVLGHGANDRTGGADLPLLRPGQALIGFLRPLGSPDTVRELAATRVTAFAVELMPRIARAQGMDALSAMSTVAGYKALVLAADTLPRMFPMLMTAAGTVTPAKVLVVGAGVAGLQAIATARRLGGVVSAYDVRPAAKEQVESLGARFVELPLGTQDAEDTRGYARAQDEGFHRRQRELLARVVAESDVVITTAVVPGRRAPVLLTGEMVAAMPPRSVIVDLAAERGGNCELTRPGETIEAHEVTIVGAVNLAGAVPYHASHMYARTLVAFFLHLAKDGRLRAEADDEIARETLLTREGEVVHPRVREELGLPPRVATEARAKEA
ncbi:MAG: NAD(P) transhydrogenase subunit alpha [Candidatus Rokubacteria bacterium GWC2_70_24]|nr:MAG: NAD(P) transhydrogenase subunit alpha [Candidatus Rokubacteria bacterium GWA2_70_23]OGK90444.1 MAG: NAD(P) transhydrogenase subunit alpha [Candidatus Rokubacteria bacterium GWF2_70_14]OGK93668.1 MAG: NAD(P) transhydrogenase subunit alpha [Candidatus Rokubacteria bacterium GWC2_70_24]HAM59838.1 Re/Si-specific NAD(P)(+) transhydrogenase subunit alpha [Candidatus Rokubacteria bacterium]